MSMLIPPPGVRGENFGGFVIGVVVALVAVFALGVGAFVWLVSDKTPAEEAASESWRRAPLVRICADGTHIYDDNGTLRAGGWGHRIAPGITADQVCPAVAVQA